MIKDYKNSVYNFKTKKYSSIHPEIGELREKLMWKDLAVFKKYKISNFLRPLYEDELKSYDKQMIIKACEGKECVAMNCFRISSDTRALIPMNLERFENAALKNKTPIYYQKQLFINTKNLKINSKKGFKND
tara:strand:+ start:1036 stop:1431 length:396 start_codon:yes stop_codon:yes gene_type:complete